MPPRLPQRRASLLRSIALVILVHVAGGCGPSGPTVEFVEGMVTLDGKPVDDCVVGFSPLDPGGVSAYGRTDATGTYRLTSLRGGKPTGGALAGRYAVTVTKQKVRDRGAGPGAAFQAARPADVIDLVPQAYSRAESSGITVSVRRGRNVGPEFRFELDSAAPPPRKER